MTFQRDNHNLLQVFECLGGTYPADSCATESTLKNFWRRENLQSCFLFPLLNSPLGTHHETGPSPIVLAFLFFRLTVSERSGGGVENKRKWQVRGSWNGSWQSEQEGKQNRSCWITLSRSLLPPRVVTEFKETEWSSRAVTVATGKCR